MNPCCCLPLRCGALTVGILDLIASSLVALLIILNWVLDGRIDWRNLSGIEILSIILMALCVISLISSALLVHGIRKKNRNLTIPWLVLSGIQIIFGIISLFASQGNIPIIVSSICVTLFEIWFWLVIYCYQKEVASAGYQRV